MEIAGGVTGRARRSAATPAIQGIDVPVADQLKFYDVWGSPATTPHMAVAWAWGFDTPFKWMKQIASHFGGTRQGMVIAWPNRIKDAGGIRTQFHHLIDIVPTILDVTGIPAPKMVNGIAQKPIEGVSMAYTFDQANANAPSTHTTQYFEMLGNRAIYHEDFPGSKPTVKQKLAAVRMLYDFLVVRQITPSNPAHSVRGPKYVVKKGKTPVWSREDAKTLLDSIPKDSVAGLRDLALIAAMFYSFARVSAVLKLKVDDYYHNGARRRLRLHEKGGKEHEMPVHHLLEQILDEYIVAAGLQSGQPLFQSVNSIGTAVTGRALNRYNAWAAIRKRDKAAGFLTPVGCHTWRGNWHHNLPGKRPGDSSTPQQMAGHESPRTTKLYDRTKDEIKLSEVEQIRL